MRATTAIDTAAATEKRRTSARTSPGSKRPGRRARASVATSASRPPAQSEAIARWTVSASSAQSVPGAAAAWLANGSVRSASRPSAEAAAVDPRSSAGAPRRAPAHASPRAPALARVKSPCAATKGPKRVASSNSAAGVPSCCCCAWRSTRNPAAASGIPASASRRASASISCRRDAGEALRPRPRRPGAARTSSTPPPSTATSPARLSHRPAISGAGLPPPAAGTKATPDGSEPSGASTVKVNDPLQSCPSRDEIVR